VSDLELYATPEYMSPSSIGTFNQCPMRYKFAKLDRLTEPSTEAQILGSFVHEILEDLFKLDAEDRNESSARKIGKHLWDKAWGQEFANLDVQDSTENQFRWKAWWCVEKLF
jgi:RecB family exonuclease